MFTLQSRHWLNRLEHLKVARAEVMAILSTGYVLRFEDIPIFDSIFYMIL